MDTTQVIISFTSKLAELLHAAVQLKRRGDEPINTFQIETKSFVYQQTSNEPLVHPIANMELVLKIEKREFVENRQKQELAENAENRAFAASTENAALTTQVENKEFAPR
eukprot:CAMPEP_0203697702 /NCGR_PEP_ID=MMETSP0091-20130426/11801_1 /ASSEMBLY_ACC=CAM_ASM_001089 /TAXON_ID=426623 /ORGANISM="Chaetoceros affinis, Strain CCMP159" /LENGTH=109 /DNA_ID=CAMNT_0050569769 /DNA_START=79 /DNA_END=408 /DNA_ORIENTATION=+